MVFREERKTLMDKELPLFALLAIMFQTKIQKTQPN